MRYGTIKENKESCGIVSMSDKERLRFNKVYNAFMKKRGFKEMRFKKWEKE